MKITQREIRELYGELVKVKKELATLEGRKAFLKASLSSVIPGGASKAGVTHVLKTGKSVSWKKISDIWKRDFIPKTKLSIALAVIPEYSKETFTHDFKVDKT